MGQHTIKMIKNKKLRSLLNLTLMLEYFNLLTIDMEIIQTNNFLFINEGEYLINPEYINVVRRINLNSTKEIQKLIQNVLDDYIAFCNTIPKLRKPETIIKNKVLDWVLLKQTTNDKIEAQNKCRAIYDSDLIEIREFEDMTTIYILFNKQPGIMHANLEYSKNKTMNDDLIIYKSDSLNVLKQKLCRTRSP